MQHSENGTNCFTEGYNACKNGESKLMCPYINGTEEWHEWLNGWELAYEEHYQHNNN